VSARYFFNAFNPSSLTGTFNVFLRILSVRIKPGEHAVLIMDQAGWHKSKAMKLPDNITVLLLPPYSPELNPAENLWHYLRSHHLANRAYRDYDDLLEANTQAYDSLTKDMIRSMCRCPYIERASQS
jgi:transposase